MTYTATFNGGPRDGELRAMPEERPLREIATYAWQGVEPRA